MQKERHWFHQCVTYFSNLPTAAMLKFLRFLFFYIKKIKMLKQRDAKQQNSGFRLRNE
jgi:hypothetical protein